eukprot:4728913-Alexandrium_andersonii.AAC.1
MPAPYSEGPKCRATNVYYYCMRFQCCLKLLQAVSGSLGSGAVRHFQALSGSFGLRPKLLESA